MKISTQFVRMISGFFGFLLVLAPLTVLAQTKTKVVVVPLGDDVVKVNPLKNVITVAKANGKFTDPVAAVNSIADASESNPYLIVIGPGVYSMSQNLQMKEYVDIVGSGENVTKMRGAISTVDHNSTSAVISGANNCALSSLTVENMGGNIYSIALHNSGTSPTLNNITLAASGGIWNYGVYNSSSSVKMTDVTTKGLAGANNFGVYNSSDSYPTMTNVTATGSGGGNNYGVYNTDSYPTMTNVTARGLGGNTQNYGVYNEVSSTPIISRSTMEGSPGLFTADGLAIVSQSSIKGGANNGTYGGNRCVACDNGSGYPIGANCQ
jgi:hypothetical protein